MEVLDTFAFGSIDDVYIVVHRAVRVSPSDWARFLEDINAQPRVPALIVVAGNGRLDADQRHQVRQIHTKHKTRIGVLQDSKVARGVMTALGWFGLTIKGFAPDDIDGLLRYIARSHLRTEIAAALTPFVDPDRLHDTAS